jgi:hypothetical protein
MMTAQGEGSMPNDVERIYVGYRRGLSSPSWSDNWNLLSLAQLQAGINLIFWYGRHFSGVFVLLLWSRFVLSKYYES